jgi:type IV secretory pathway ATPase VirB11/archaellum biosynthesis ATPase
MMTIASMQKTTVTEMRPVLETQLPIWKYRFAGLIEPVVLSPSFAIRVKSDKKRSLRDLQRQGILTTKDDPRNRRSEQEDFRALLMEDSAAMLECNLSPSTINVRP